MLLWETETETWGSEARKQCFIVPAQTQQTHVQRLSLENKGVSPYVSLQAGYRGKTTTTTTTKTPRFNPYMVICNSIGYFTLVLSALLPLVLSALLHIWIL
jgi:hypothetical protein